MKAIPMTDPEKTNDPVEAFFADRAAGLCHEAQTERAAVNRILVKSGIPAKQRAATTFTELVTRPCFPMALHLVKPHKFERIDLLNDLYNRPTKSFLYETHTAIAEENLDQLGMLGIVLPWRGTHVFHDLDTRTLGTCGIYTKISGRYYYLEHLDSLLARLGQAEDW